MDKLLDKNGVICIPGQTSKLLKTKSLIPKPITTLTKNICGSWPGSSDSWSRSGHIEGFSRLQSDRIRLIGQRVRIGGVKEGTVRYLGLVQFAEGCWCGVELDEPVGKNDGSVQGIRYFTCGQRFGIFAPIRKVETVFSLKEDLVDKNTTAIDNLKSLPLTEKQLSRSRFPLINQTSNYYSRSWSEIQHKSTSSFQLNNSFLVMTQHVSSNENISKSFEIKSSHFNEEFAPPPIHHRDKNPRDLEDRTGLGSSESLVFNNIEQGNNDQEQRQNVSSSSSSSGDECKDVNKALLILPLEKHKDEMDYFSCGCNAQPSLLSNNHQMFDSETFEGDDDDDSKQDLSLDDLQQQRMTFDLGGLLKNENDFDGGFWADQEDSLGILSPNQMMDFTEQHSSLVSDLDAVSLPKTFSFDEVNELPDSEIVEDVAYERNVVSQEIHQASSPSLYHKSSPIQRLQEDSTSSYVGPYSNNQIYEFHLASSPCGANSSSPVQETYQDLASYDPQSVVHQVSFHGDHPANNILKDNEMDYLMYELRAADSDPSFNPEVGVDDVSSSSNTWTTIIWEKPHGDFSERAHNSPLRSIAHGKDKSNSNVKRGNEKEAPFDELVKESTLSISGNGSTTQNNVEVNDSFFGEKKHEMLPGGSEIRNDDTNCSVGLSKHMDFLVGINTETSEESFPLINFHYNSIKTLRKEQQDKEVISNNNDVKDVCWVNYDRFPSKATNSNSHEDGEFESEESGQGTLVSSGEEGCMKFSTYSQDSGVASDGHESERHLKAGSMTDSDLFTDGGLGTSLAESESEQSDVRPYRQDNKDFYKLTEDDVCPEHHKIKNRIEDEVNCQQNVTVPFTEKSDVKWEVKLTIVPEENIPNCNYYCVTLSKEGITNRSGTDNVPKKEILDLSEDITSSPLPEVRVNKSTEISQPVLHENENSSDRVGQIYSKETKDTENRTPTKLYKSKKEVDILSTVSDTATVISSNEKKPKHLRKNVKSKVKEIFVTSTESQGTRDRSEERKKLPRTSKKNKWDAVTAKIAASMDEDKLKTKKKEIKSKINTNLKSVRQGASTKSSRTISECTTNSINEEKPNQTHHSAKAKENDSVVVEMSKDIFSKTSETTCEDLWTVVKTTGRHDNEVHHVSSTRYQVSPTASPSSDISSTSFIFLTPAQVNSEKPNKVVNTTNSGSITKATTALRSNSTILSRSSKTHGQMATSTKDIPKRFTNQTSNLLKPATVVKAPISRTTNLTKKEKERRPGLPAEQRKSRREYVQEIQRLGALCETRTKELKLLKIQLKHAFLGFDSFSIVVKYLTEELDALSHPRILSELKKTRDDLQKTEAQLRRYETHLEQLKRNHEDEIQELTSKLAATHREEIETLIVNHQEELRKLQDEHDKEVEDLKTIHAQSAKDAQSRNSLSVAALKEQHNRLIEDLEKDFANQMQQAVESHEKALDSLKQQLQDLQKQCEDLQLEKKQMESSLQEDTNTKLQWVLAQKSNLQKEVESLQTVLELKVADIHHLRTENLEMQKELEKLPSARQEIQKLKARNEDLQAMVDEKVRIERQLASESLHLKEEFEKEFKSKSRLSMEKEELQWRLKQTMEASALLSTMSDSSSEILDKLLHDESLLKSPVRMSVFLNELDTSLTQGGRSPGSHRQVTAGGRPPNTMSNPENCSYYGRPSSRSSPPTPITKKLRCSNQSDSVDGTPKRSRSNKSPIRETNRSDHSSAIEVCDAQNPTNGHAENDDLTPKQQRMSYYTSSVNVSQKNLNLNAPHPENNEDEESYSVTSDHHHCTKSDVFCPERRMVFSNSPESSLSVCQGKGPSLLEFTDNEAHVSREKEQQKSKSET